MATGMRCLQSSPVFEGKRIVAVGYNGGRAGFCPGPNVANPSRRVASSVDRDDSSHQKQFYDKQKSHPHLHFNLNLTSRIIQGCLFARHNPSSSFSLQTF